MLDRSRISKRSKKIPLNVNKNGAVRETNGKAYVDFLYLGQRVRESSGLPWTAENAKKVRVKLDRIMLAISDGKFQFRIVFPKSKKVEYFTDLERKLLKRGHSPDEVKISQISWDWYQTHKETDRVSPRTLHGYKSHLDLYIIPFFGELNFSQINPATIDDFTVWAKQQQLRNKELSNTTINKILIPLKMICKRAAMKFNWGATFNPFFGYSKLKKQASDYQIEPFSVEEQQRVIEQLPDHWKPYFRFAFLTGLRQGEQLVLRPSDVDLSKNQLCVKHALTLDEQGKVTEGNTKNVYSRRTINLLPAVVEILQTQLNISRSLGSEYLFCTPLGDQVQRDNLRKRTWKPALKAAGIPYRRMSQTRHSFATTALSAGENPLWIGKTLGHSNAKMVLEVYGKYTKDNNGGNDGSLLNEIYTQE